ncbi:MAG TPA: ATP synthase F1 subunit gamma [Cryomorphaceae bacterium]|jgi:F-type H+-transporting ATPase subunit gamma|nr:MAG: ATP F0F1 synthase subunit gamma [Cryomorphaceae bacterium BACL7 MAG-120910-bin2]KRO68346.1 MAG: ATP F0F1 synthase subunit gamma [Cryomorphaceae bacterium BACL7 MAG-120322-bin74]KRO83078.1 MAG: ATP F0F1 synthase subunit gamma [Cryomorphaceae bacterium BACL7 MAG-121220-bin83]NQW25946.1 ATP synthase F1 subunit gamma [Cryomorphaceae bacterium]HAB30914.1 ATP synthase F1 subunit gamma [Cryomorphaceae bacterium]|tara:strand:- start:2673 stop:3533 length:861 start_codon:yes stop_codon:yes gene_type:complete
MANLKELRNRIASVSSTMQITSAMKMVSAAKLKRSQDAIVQMRPYAQKLTALMGNISATLDASENPYAQERPTQRVLLISLTANRGLCGAFNSSVIKRTRSVADAYEAQGAKVSVFTVGKKSRDLLKKTMNVVGEELEVVNQVNFEGAQRVAEVAMVGYVAGAYDKVVLVYNQFKNAAVQILQEEQLLPILPALAGQGQASDYIYEPNKVQLLEELIPTSIKSQVFKALLDSQASEHGARMTSMHKATDNATSMRDGLKLQYNKARQAAITNEILEIVGGAEALSG